MDRKDWYEQLKDNGDIIDRGTYLNVPYNILDEEIISTHEKLILAMVLSLTDKGMECYMSNEYISSTLKLSPSAPSKMVKNLAKVGYIKAYYKFKPYSKTLKGRVLEPSGKYFKQKIPRERGYIYKLIEFENGKDKENTEE
jgi:hypothetical protein